MKGRMTFPVLDLICCRTSRAARLGRRFPFSGACWTAAADSEQVVALELVIPVLRKLDKKWRNAFRC